ncbi:transcriptional attenuator, LytR family [Anaerovirgula multivorans]|uniref:Transcriptional attenuator, LytR family n=1 Tax=Anaerovirgula multivorans TaxID=312168 RepID=A0A239L2W1_9FIRM|nr:LCP family protein [Anaerovirgula multivorans]SNT24143.1 transcriptional attenuator, LytR family [Anaerovirgula multivorans]
MNKNKILWIGITSILCILLLIGVIGFEKYDNMKNPHQAFEKDLKQEEEVDSTEESTASGKNVINLLLLGVDSTEVREAREMGYRSDSIMVVSMNLDTKKVKLISIPRDSYTEVPGNDNKDKINHAMAFGGGPRKNGNQYAVEAVEGLLGINIHYYVTMDLDAVKDIVDTIGGVTVDVERSMGSGERRLQKGEQNLNGQQALIYLSNRTAPTGDFARIQQQQKFMMALFRQTKEKGKFSDIIPLYLKMQNKVFTDLRIDQMGALVLFLKDINPEDIEIYTLKGRDMMIDDIYYLDIDREHMKEILN